MRLAYLVIEAGAGAAVGQFSTALVLAAVLPIELDGPLLRLLLERCDDGIALGAGTER